MENKIDFLDVYNLDELPKLQSDKRYLEFLGGTKKYRCFIVDNDYPRCEFYKNNLDLIDEMLQPIYKNRGIIVAQDNTFPVPGFYIISYDEQYKSITELSESIIARTSKIIKAIRKIMNDKLGIKYVNVYYEEKASESANVHYWIMPKYDNLDLTKKLYEINMNEYLNSFDYIENKEKIKKFNNIIKKELININYKKFDDELYNKIETIEKKINLCIGKRCFMICKGCYNNFCEDEDVSYEKLIKFLKYAKSKGLEKITLSGGDPFTRKDIGKIINKCNKLGLKINLDTVGLPLTKSRVIPATGENIKKFSNFDVLKKIDLIGIPLDGSNNDIISKFRIYNGNLFNEIIDILNYFDEKKIKICVNTVLHKGNINDIKKIYSIIRKHKCIKKWQIFQFMPLGNLGSKNASLYEIDAEEFEIAKEKVFKMKQKDNLSIEFKSSRERTYNYMLVNSSGLAYKVDLDNKVEIFGKIDNELSWDNIINNLF